MTDVSYVNISADWHKPVTREDERRDRMLDFFTRVHGLHPLMSEWSPAARYVRGRKALNQPSIFALSPEEWEKSFADGQDAASYYRAYEVWNRNLEAESKVRSLVTFHEGAGGKLHIQGQLRYPDGSSVMSKLPHALITGAILSSILEANILSYSADRATISQIIRVRPSPPPPTNIYDAMQPKSSMTQRELAERYGGERYSKIYENYDTPLWKLWLREGEAWPEPGIKGGTHLQLWQCDEPYECEDWLDGKLYTWSQFSPWLSK